MSKMKVEGSFVALITPFNQDGTADFGAFRTLLKFQESHGTSAVLIMGSTGEVSMLSQQERQAIIVETAKMKTGTMKFFYGCTGNNTETTKDYLRFAKANGADGAILAAPSYICGLESDIEDYFLEVADATDLPLGLYNNPPGVKTDLHWDNLIRIFKHPNYVVHKESTTRVGQVAQVLRANTDVAVMCCDSPNLGLVVPTISLGGHGTANMTGNIAPSEMAALSTPWTTPDISVSFRATYLHILSLLHFSYSAINPVAIKSPVNCANPSKDWMARPCAKACASSRNWGWTRSTAGVLPHSNPAEQPIDPRQRKPPWISESPAKQHWCSVAARAWAAPAHSSLRAKASRSASLPAHSRRWRWRRRRFPRRQAMKCSMWLPTSRRPSGVMPRWRPALRRTFWSTTRTARRRGIFASGRPPTGMPRSTR